MSDKNLAGLDLANLNLADSDLNSLEKQTFEQLQSEKVRAVILGLGSNYQADYYLPQVRKSLAELGQIKLSTALQNPDITASQEQPKPDYINQCVRLILNDNMTLGELQRISKELEQQCGRQRQANIQSSTKQVNVKPVSMDIDILLVKLGDNKNSLSDNENDWIIIAQRFPFKEHEILGTEGLGLQNL